MAPGAGESAKKQRKRHKKSKGQGAVDGNGAGSPAVAAAAAAAPALKQQPGAGDKRKLKEQLLAGQQSAAKKLKVSGWVLRARGRRS